MVCFIGERPIFINKWYSVLCTVISMNMLLILKDLTSLKTSLHWFFSDVLNSVKMPPETTINVPHSSLRKYHTAIINFKNIFFRLLWYLHFSILYCFLTQCFFVCLFFPKLQHYCIFFKTSLCMPFSVTVLVSLD